MKPWSRPATRPYCEVHSIHTDCSYVLLSFFSFFFFFLRTGFSFIAGIVTYAVAWVTLGQSAQKELSADNWKEFTVWRLLIKVISQTVLATQANVSQAFNLVQVRYRLATQLDRDGSSWIEFDQAKIFAQLASHVFHRSTTSANSSQVVLS